MDASPPASSYEAERDGAPHEAIGAGCDETRLLICLGHEAPCGTKLRAARTGWSARPAQMAARYLQTRDERQLVTFPDFTV